MSDALQVTPASQWRRQTEVKQLPSGLVVELQRPSFVDAIMGDGSLPEGLATVIFEGFFNTGNSEWKPKPEDLPKLAEMISKICRAAFANPRIVEQGQIPDYDNGQIALADVIDADRRWVLEWAISGGQAVPAVTKFPKKSVAGLSSRSNGKTLRNKTG